MLFSARQGVDTVQGPVCELRKTSLMTDPHGELCRQAQSQTSITTSILMSDLTGDVNHLAAAHQGQT